MSVLGWLLLLFIVTPLVELWLLILVGEQVGATATIAIVLVTGTIGATLSRRQGLRTWGAIQEQLQQGKLPTDDLLDGLMIFIAGLLLITPGILTDIVGFSLLIPLVRRGLRWRLRGSFRVQTGIHVQSFGSSVSRHSQSTDDEAIDVEFERHSTDNSLSSEPDRNDAPSS
ncbi:hypothetical protein GC176_18345 [bacterium]|nr:hypothetical protein [bacterium]